MDFDMMWNAFRFKTDEQLNQIIQTALSINNNTLYINAKKELKRRNNKDKHLQKGTE